MNSPLAFADLRILATSDVHMHITRWDALHDRTVAGRGMDVLASTIETARQTAKGACVLFDNGDSLQGTPVGTICATQPSDMCHPWPDILNALSYDAVGLGNHDFDFGVPFLERTVAQSHAPTLCASFTLGRVSGVVPAHILNLTVTCSDGEVRPIVIGVTSVLPPQTAIWNHRYLTGLIEFEAGVTAARRAVATLQAQSADIIVLLCHSGLGARDADDDENFGTRIANEVEGIDAIVLGHTHEQFPKPDGPKDLNGVPAVMPGYGAEALGQIDLRLGRTENGWHVAGHDATLRAPDESEAPVSAVTDLAAPALVKTGDALGRTLAHTDRGFNTYFGMLVSGASDALIARSMTSVIAAQVAGSTLADLPLIASAASMTMGGRAGPGNYVDVPAGPVRMRHIAMLAPYPNAIWAAVLTGADLIKWVERAAAFYSPSSEGGFAKLVNPDAPSFNFDMLHGVEAIIDPFRPAMFDPIGHLINPTARRVRRLLYKGALVDLDDPFLVAMTSYRGAGGGNFPGLSGNARILRTDHDLTEALQRTVAREAETLNHTPSVWRFTSQAKKRVIIETSPNAQNHLDEIAAFEPQVIGQNEAGFLELSVLI